LTKILHTITICLITVTLFGCGGDGGEHIKNFNPLAVVSISPGSQSLDIARDTPIRIEFSRALNQSTVTANSIRLTDSDGDIFTKYNLVVDAQTVELMLTEPLYPNTEYFLSVSNAVTDISGISLESEYTSSFTTTFSDWNGNEPIVQNGGDVFAAIDNHGNAVNVTWSYNYSNAHYQIGKSELRNGVWSNWSVISEPVGQTYYPGYRPSVAMDNYGNTIVVWDQWVDSAVIMREYRNGNWSDLTYVDHPGDGTISSPSVTMSDAGNSLILWSRNGNIQQVEYRNGSWGLQKQISTDNNVESHLVKMNSVGDGIAVWKHRGSVSGADKLFSSRFTQGNWSSPVIISVDGVDPGGYRIAFNENGNAIVVWDQLENINTAIYKNELKNGMWSGPEIISDVNAFSIEPAVDMGGAGSGIIVWKEYFGGVNSIKALHLANGTWSEPVTLGSGVSNKRLTTVKVDIKGNAVAAWSEENGSDWQLRIDRYLEGVWSGNQLFATSNNSLNPIPSCIDTNDSGETIIVWEQFDAGMWYFYRNLYN